MTYVSYVGNENDGTVSVIPLGASSPSHTITGFDGNSYMANRPDGSLIYVTNSAANTVSVIQAATNTIIHTINVGNSPLGVAFSPDGTTAYVVNSGDGTVSIIDVASHSVTSTKSVAAGITGIAVRPDSTGSAAYITAPANNKVYSFNTSTYAVSAITDSSSTFNEPLNVAFTTDGNHAYVTNFGSNTVSIINFATGAVTSALAVGTTGSAPNGIVMNPNGNYAYVANQVENTVAIITLSGPSASTGFTMPGTNPQPVALSITSDSAVLYATLGNASEIVPITLEMGGSSGTVGTVIPTVTGTTPLSIVTFQPASIPMTSIYTAPQGRLTLTSNTPVMNADVTGATNVYYTPYQGNIVPIYDGANMQSYTFSQLTMTLNTSNQLSGKIYDLFVFLNSSVVTIGAGPAWSSTTSRGTGAGTTQLQQTDGLWTNANSMTLTNGSSSYSGIAAGKATYLGSVYMTANGQTSMQFQPAGASGGSIVGGNVLGLYNAYNRVTVASRSIDSTTTWSYNSTTVRPVNNSTSNRINWVDGLQQSFLQCEYQVQVNSPSGNDAYIGIGLDSTTTGQSSASGVIVQVVAVSLVSTSDILPQLGFHYVQALEMTGGSVAANFYSGNPTPGNLMHLKAVLEM